MIRGLKYPSLATSAKATQLLPAFPPCTELSHALLTVRQTPFSPSQFEYFLPTSCQAHTLSTYDSHTKAGPQLTHVPQSVFAFSDQAHFLLATLTPRLPVIHHPLTKPASCPTRHSHTKAASNSPSSYQACLMSYSPLSHQGCQ